MANQSWSQNKIASFDQSLLDWYDLHRRHLPWRQTKDPYAIWVSEIMLQQTQVKTVIPYFQRFMTLFPTIASLAEAQEAALLKVWEGLGYYSRVRNMQTAAQQIIDNFSGEMPSDPQQILSLKGIGPYTGGAIASIAFDRPVPAVDGNVMRVYSRLFTISDNIAIPKTRKIFDQLVQQTISRKRAGDFNQALMDIGATICTPTSPLCDECPLKSYCQAYQTRNVDAFPVKTKAKKPVSVYYLAGVIESDQKWIIEQRSADELLANMWTFPLYQVDELTYKQFYQQWQVYQAEKKALGQLSMIAEDDSNSLADFLAEKKPAVVWQKQPVGEVQHVFSHRCWHLLMVRGFVSPNQSFELNDRQEWLTWNQSSNHPFPKPQEKMVNLLAENKSKK